MIHLLLGALLLALSLLTVLPPPTNFLWMLSVLAKEWGYLFALLCLTLLWPTWIDSWTAALGALFGLVAAALFLVPLLRAVPMARQFTPFGETEPAPDDRPAPFVIKDLLLGVRAPRAQVRTVTYAVRGERELKMDLYPPAVTPAPAVLVIHGGSWRGGDRKQLPALNHYLAARGYLVAAIDYRLAPAHRFPDVREDVLAALAYLKDHAAELGADPERIAILGRSAGAQLALVAAYLAGGPAVRGVISYYGPFELAWGYYQHCRVIDPRQVLGDFLGGDPACVPELYREASPASLVGPDTPPTLLIQGEADTMAPPYHSLKLVEKLEAAGRPYQLVLVPSATHGSDFNFSGPFGQISTYAVERFLRAVMKGAEEGAPAPAVQAGAQIP